MMLSRFLQLSRTGVRAWTGGGGGCSVPPPFLKVLKFFGQNADDSDDSTCENTCIPRAFTLWNCEHLCFYCNLIAFVSRIGQTQNCKNVISPHTTSPKLHNRDLLQGIVPVLFSVLIFHFFPLEPQVCTPKLSPRSSTGTLRASVLFSLSSSLDSAAPCLWR